MLDGLFGLDVNWATLGIALLAVGALAYLIAEVAASAGPHGIRHRLR